MCSANSRSVMGAASGRGSFKRILDGIVLLISSSRLFTPIFSNITGRSSSCIPICRSANKSVFMVVVYKLNFKFYLIGKKGCSLFLLPQWSGLHDQDRLPCRGEVQTNDCIYVREVRRNYLL